MSLDKKCQLFITQSYELLDERGETLTELEHSPNDVVLIRRIFKTAHFLEVLADIFGIKHIILFARALESLLNDMHSRLIPVTTNLINLLMRLNNHISNMIENLANRSPINIDGAQVKQV